MHQSSQLRTLAQARSVAAGVDHRTSLHAGGSGGGVLLGPSVVPSSIPHFAPFQHSADSGLGGRGTSMYPYQNVQHVVGGASGREAAAATSTSNLQLFVQQLPHIMSTNIQRLIDAASLFIPCELISFVTVTKENDSILLDYTYSRSRAPPASSGGGGGASAASSSSSSWSSASAGLDEQQQQQQRLPQPQRPGRSRSPVASILPLHPYNFYPQQHQQQQRMFGVGNSGFDPSSSSSSSYDANSGNHHQHSPHHNQQQLQNSAATTAAAVQQQQIGRGLVQQVAISHRPLRIDKAPSDCRVDPCVDLVHDFDLRSALLVRCTRHMHAAL
jgi:hypothetical protein